MNVDRDAAVRALWDQIQEEGAYAPRSDAPYMRSLCSELAADGWLVLVPTPWGFDEYRFGPKALAK